MIIYRSQCCCYLTVVLATISTDVRYTDTQTQTWRKWTTIWREKQYVLSENTCYFNEHGWFISLVGSLNLHHCIISFPSLPFFSVSRSLCVDREVSFPTQIFRPFRCLSPAICGHITTGYGSHSSGYASFGKKYLKKNNCQQEQWFQFLTFTGCLHPFSPEKWAIAADGCRLH